LTRFDDIGMFWEDLPSDGKRGAVNRVMPAIPDTGWTMPTTFPNLSSAKVLSLDVETYDPDLLTRGPGWARGVGHIVGISVGADNDGRWYFPIRHEIEPENNLDPEVVFKWLRHTFSNPKQPKVGANILYDIGWLNHEKVEVAGPVYDVQYAEALLHESARVSLEILSQKYLDEGKEFNMLYQWCSDFYGGNPNEKQRKNIYRTPARLTGPYAVSDADLPLRILVKQWPLLIKENLLDIFNMECEMIPLYIAMRFAGVTVNVPYAEKLRDELEASEKIVQEKLNKTAGFKVNTNASNDLAKVFDKQGLGYNKTAKGNPSFTKDFLKTAEHPVANLIKEVRKLSKLRGTFVESYILDSHVNGKVYGQFHPLRSDDGGTRSGRYSSSNPNLQNIPIRTIEGNMIRGVFIPDMGHLTWRKYDYSQIEYRFLVHYAIGVAGREARKMFNANPDLDYHVFAQTLVKEKTGMFIERKPIKNINFGLIYGMGIKLLAKQLGISMKEAKHLFQAYFEAIPFAKETMEDLSTLAQKTGEITTILGRKSRFNTWEPTNWHDKRKPLPYEWALREYGQIKRAGTHKALNRRLQGSAADLLKKAMWRCWKEGIFDETGVPRLTVHDELDFSDPGGKDEAFKEMKYIMETAIPLKIPVKVDYEKGDDWGHVKVV